MLHLLCKQCSDVAVRLLHLSESLFRLDPIFCIFRINLDVVAALRILLLGTVDPLPASSELVARTHQELFEIVVLIGCVSMTLIKKHAHFIHLVTSSELWPALPSDGLFEVDSWLKTSSLTNEHILWTWKDEKGTWRPFMHVDNRILEVLMERTGMQWTLASNWGVFQTAYQSKEEELTLSTMGQTFAIDLINMIQINEETGHSLPIQRRVASSSSPAHSRIIYYLYFYNLRLFFAEKSGSRHSGSSSSNSSHSTAAKLDSRVELLKTHPKLYEESVRCLFPVLYEIYTSVV